MHGRHVAAAAVAGVGDTAGQLLVTRSRRSQVPGPNRIPAGAGKGDVVHAHAGVDTRFVRDELHRRRARPRLGERPGPERVEPLGLLGGGAMDAKLVERQVEERHRSA